VLRVTAVQPFALGVPLCFPAGTLVIVTAEIDDADVGHGHKLRRPHPRIVPLSLADCASCLIRASTPPLGAATDWRLESMTGEHV
jgi:hypothetical protein